LLLHKHDPQGALQVLTKTTNTREHADDMLQSIKDDHENSKEDTDSVFSKKYNIPLTLAFLIAFFNQLSGINFILYYAPEILEKAGFASSDSLQSSIFIGLVNLIATFIGMALIDKAGRKQLMYIGSAGYIISLFMVAYGF